MNPTDSRDDFVQQFGFASVAALKYASWPASSHTGQGWWIARCLHDTWLAWNENNFSLCERFGSLEEAVVYVRNCVEIEPVGAEQSLPVPNATTSPKDVAERAASEKKPENRGLVLPIKVIKQELPEQPVFSDYEAY